LYVFPIVFAVGGINFPIGVLIYWFTTNLWTMGQQFWVIRNNPQPGTPAYEALESRKNAKIARKGGVITDVEVTDIVSVTPERVQPKRTSKSKRSTNKKKS
jgi:YidC/Oxa1 family membrane protein insertase